MPKKQQPLEPLIPLDELKKVLAKIVPPVLPKEKVERVKVETKQQAASKKKSRS